MTRLGIEPQPVLMASTLPLSYQPVEQNRSLEINFLYQFSLLLGAAFMLFPMRAQNWSLFGILSGLRKSWS